jgi:shikimate kinase
LNRGRIALVGMPGSGKSTVGRMLARHLGTRFVDSDHEIEARIGASIRTFFEQHGEARFRDIEHEALDDLTAGSGGIIATGGGAVLRDDNRALLRERTHVVYLRSSPEELFKRLRHDTQRPLLQVRDPLKRLRDLFELRDPLYLDAAHFVIETGRPSVGTLVNMVASQLELAGVWPSTPTPSPSPTPAPASESPSRQFGQPTPEAGPAASPPPPAPPSTH